MPLARVLVLPRVDVEDPGFLIPDVAELADADAVGVDPREEDADADKVLRLTFSTERMQLTTSSTRTPPHASC